MLDLFKLSVLNKFAIFKYLYYYWVLLLKLRIYLMVLVHLYGILPYNIYFQLLKKYLLIMMLVYQLSNNLEMLIKLEFNWNKSKELLNSLLNHIFDHLNILQIDFMLIHEKYNFHQQVV